jgi:hypothetical protein
MVATKCFGITLPSSGNVLNAHHATRHNTPIHNILSTAPQLSISQKTLGTLRDDDNVMLKLNELSKSLLYLLVFHAYFLLGILIFKGLTARRLYKSFGVKWLIKITVLVLVTS